MRFQEMNFEIVLDNKAGKVVKINPLIMFDCKPRFRSFKIQTKGNLPECHKLLTGTRISAHCEVDLWEEIVNYIQEHGTEKQKIALGCE